MQQLFCKINVCWANIAMVIFVGELNKLPALTGSGDGHKLLRVICPRKTIK